MRRARSSSISPSAATAATLVVIASDGEAERERRPVVGLALQRDVAMTNFEASQSSHVVPA
jgi:hypothetical protein